MKTMMKGIFLAAAVSGAGIATPAVAFDTGHGTPAHVAAQQSNVLGYGDRDNRWRDRRDRDYRDRDYRDRDRYSRSSYEDRDYRGARNWNGQNQRYNCRRKDGTTGLIIGGAAGALLGREVDTRGDRTLGTVLGAAGGALLGKKVAQGQNNCR
ncbi:glycine zipper 2TM domain-containing protein [Altericroceibacterium xinjiangense]|uniref:glycine zipper 2TM domain-containing protein n=1 Tax=Altericroceibacterium xinjiangense TaxID=762261 RepID=UPI001F49C996|nr:glycine zipper 2TM domain-containing protein [Altericroceibacterium xinjiangense]